ncbi:MAG: hypothetical protein KJ556_21480 [Gammaproteobacteria bacterium]|nr:hypothetical protein [Gammaproteobacteria bacterium]
MILLPRRRALFTGGEAGPDSWADWDELTEAGLASDDTFVCFFKSATGNETGQGGGLTGVNLVLTEFGDPAAAAGTPPSRLLDGTGDYFTVNSTLAGLITQSTAWTIIIKVEDAAINLQTAFIQWTGTDEQILLSGDNNAPMTVTWLRTQQDTNYETGTEDIWSNSGFNYVCIWADGTDLRAGYATSKPTKWSDFAATKRHLFTVNTGDYTGETFTVNRFFSWNGANELACKAYFVVVSKKGDLIDNAS